MVKWGTAYPTSRRNFLLITFNWVANALVCSTYLMLDKVWICLSVTSLWSSPSIGLLMLWYAPLIQFLKANVCGIKCCKGIQRSELLLSQLECQLPPGILHQLCRWGQFCPKLLFHFYNFNFQCESFRFPHIFLAGGLWTNGGDAGFSLRQWW